MTAFEIFQSLVIVFLSASFWVEYWIAGRATSYAKEALEGWKKAIDLHAEDRATFVGAHKLMQAKDEWPDVITKSK